MGRGAVPNSAQGEREPFVLQENEIHVWNFGSNVDGKRLKDYSDLLSPDEIERAGRFKFSKDRANFIVSRGVLRLLSGRYLQMEPNAITFGYSEYGKPFYVEPSELNFNLSHSGRRIIIAFCKGLELGVDIEKVDDNDDYLKLATHFFSPFEIGMLSKIRKPEIARAFYRCWTRKESLIKADGTGLSFPLDSFSVSMDNDLQADLLETKWDLSEKHHWRMFSFVPFPGYMAAVAIKGEVDTIKHRNFEDYQIR